MDERERPESDEELLAYMAMRDEDETGARCAWSEFHMRHVKFVYFALMRSHSSDFTSQTLEDFAAETMLRAFERAATFNPDRYRRRDSGADCRGASAKGWLMGIAKNLVNDAFAMNDEGGLEDIESVQETGAPPLEPVTNEAISIARGVLDELDERERDVMRLTLDYHPERVSPGKMKALADRLHTTTPHLRKIRERTYAKLEKALRKAGLPKPRGRSTR